MRPAGQSMLSQTTRYALRILGFLADRPQERVQGRAISRATGIPSNYLSKVLSQLGKRRFVASQKGRGGGFQLRQGVLSVPVLAVVEVFEGQRDRACLFGFERCDEFRACPLHHHWEEVWLSYERMLNQVAIGDLREAKGEPAVARPRRRRATRASNPPPARRRQG
jgi:Rrf2 family nitric oxide-sensitive transcriptional repressor